MSDLTKSLLLKCTRFGPVKQCAAFGTAMALMLVGIVMLPAWSPLLLVLEILIIIAFFRYGSMIHKKQLYDADEKKFGADFADEVYLQCGWEKWWEK